MAAELFQRTIFVSDVHLGSRGVQAHRFVQFLRRIACERLYLIGDIVDWLEIGRRSFWADAHRQVLDELLVLVGSGVRVTYVPGNHDSIARRFGVEDLLGIELAREVVHDCADGRRMLIVHGDQFDRSGQLATAAADAVVACMQWAARGANRLGLAMGLPYYPYGSRVRRALQRAIPYVRRFEQVAAAEARRSSCHGIVCGHVHIPALKHVGETLYCNTGDWVDSCTAIAESPAGVLQLLDWTALEARRTRRAAALRRSRRTAAVA